MSTSLRHPQSSPFHVRPTLGQILAHELSRYATHAFGLMGNGNAHVIDGLREAGVSYVAVRHEAATIAAADAYTRVSGQLAIATTTYGAGFTNALTALAEAVQARTPMLVVVGDAPTSGPRPWDVDQPGLATAVGATVYRIPVTDIMGTVGRAVAHTWRTRTPVVLAVPYDLVDVSVADPGVADADLGRRVGCDVIARHSATVTRNITRDASVINADEVAVAAAALLRARRPVVLAGAGAWRSGVGSALDEIARLLGAPTASTVLARGLFADDTAHLGVTGGFGVETAMKMVAEADTVLIVGASLNQFTMRFGELLHPDVTIVRIDLDEAPAPPEHEQVLVRGDARAALTAILDGLRQAGREPSGYDEVARRARAAGSLSHTEALLREGGVDPSGLCADGRLDPRVVAMRIAEYLPDDIHVTQDGGHFIGWANMFWPIRSPERMVMVGTAYQAIGLGLGTVAGVATAAPESTVVLSTGDGGGLMALADLETAIRVAGSCVIVVWNDSAYGAEVHLYGAMGLGEEPMRIPNIDFAALGRGLGAQALRVEVLADLDELARWRDAGARGTILLDCQISPSVVAPHQREIQRIHGLDVSDA